MKPDKEFYDLKTSAYIFRNTPDFLLYGFFHDQNDYEKHFQEFTEIVFILDGDAEYYTPPSGRERISRGDIMITPSSGIHGYYNTKGLKIFNLLFVADRLPLPVFELYTHPGYRYMFMHPVIFYEAQGYYPMIKVSEEKLRVFEFYLEQFARFQEHLKTTKQHCGVLGVFMAILSLLCDEWQRHHAEKQSEMPLDIIHIMKYLNEHYAENITLKNLMLLTAMSENTLLRHFRKILGKSPIQYLLEVRLTNAAAYLLKTSMRVSEIAELCGFNTATYFIKMFKRSYGMTPEQFRNYPNN